MGFPRSIAFEKIDLNNILSLISTQKKVKLIKSVYGDIEE